MSDSTIFDTLSEIPNLSITTTGLSVSNENTDIDKYIDISVNPESACSLKESYEDYADINKLNGPKYRKKRTFADNVTAAFVDIFFEPNPENVAAFINYTYQVINFNVKTNINTQIVDVDGLKPLQYYEHFKLYFKGGTSMNMLYKRIMANLNQLIATPGLSAEERTDIEANIAALSAHKSNFAISDTDMGIKLTTINNARYKQLHYFITQQLVISCREIAQTLELLWTQEFPSSDEFLAWLESAEQAYPYQWSADIQAMYAAAGSFSSPAVGITQYSTLLERVKLIKKGLAKGNALPATSDIRKLFNEYRKGHQDSQICAVLVELMDYIKVYNPALFSEIDGLAAGQESLRALLVMCGQYKLHRLFMRLIDLQIYTPATKRLFMEKIVQKIKGLPTDVVYHDIRYGNGSYYKLIAGHDGKSKVEVEHIAVHPRKDFILKTIDNPISPTQLIIFNGDTKRNMHYVSYNAAIKIKGNYFIYDFNLARIKLNVVGGDMLVRVKNLMGDPEPLAVGHVELLEMPSEILDVTIPSFYDTNLNEMPAELALIVNNGEYIYTYSNLTHVYDLSNILFRQQYLNPWFDGKYDKRIIRMLFFACAHYATSGHAPGKSPLQPFIDLNVQLQGLKQYIKLVQPVIAGQKNRYKTNNRSALLQKIMAIANLVLLNPGSLTEANIIYSLNNNISLLHILMYEPEYVPLDKFLTCILIWPVILFSGEIHMNTRLNILKLINKQAGNINPNFVDSEKSFSLIMEQEIVYITFLWEVVDSFSKMLDVFSLMA